MSEIKSAWEIAQQKIAKISEPTDAERMAWQYTPKGEQLAAQYLKEDINLTAELSKFTDEKVRHFIVQGICTVLSSNFNLPKNEVIDNQNYRILETIKSLKQDKVAVENVFSKIRRLFQYYQEQGEEQRQQAYLKLKAEMAARLEQAIQQRMGAGLAANIDVERQPEFQSELRNLYAQLDNQYLMHLNEYKEELQECR